MNSCRSLAHDVVHVLQQGLSLLRCLDDTAYTRPETAVFNGSIGGHYRHSLEHFEALLPAMEGNASQVDYDARRRDLALETDRVVAIARTEALLARFAEPSPRPGIEVLTVRCKTATEGDDRPGVTSSLERELMYAVVHAIHHYALIQVICGLSGVVTPPDFGIAPSTLAHRRQEATLPLR